MWYKLFVLVLVVFTVSFQEGIVSCQKSIDVEDALKQSGDEELEIRDFNQSNIKVNDTEKALKEKCEKSEAPNAVELLKDEQHRAKVCIRKYINVTQIEKELEIAQRTGSLDEVFANYCNKWPLIFGCFDNVTLYMRQCMDYKEEESFNKTIDIIKALKDFMCFRDGARLATFVEEGGVKCLKEQQEGINKCFNETFGATLPGTDDFSTSSLPTIVFSARNCGDFDKLRKCVHDELEQCENITPANIVDAFLKFLKKQMPCNNEKCVSATQKNTKHGPVTGIAYCQSSFEDWLKQNSINQPDKNVDDIEKALKEKCEKHGAPNAVELLKDEQNRARECINKYINATQIEKELEIFQENGSMDELFAKYCNKWPLIYGCFDNVTLYMRKCMDNKEEEAFNKTLDIINKIKEFMCSKEGDRLARGIPVFVAEGGVKCMKEQQEGINKCFNETVGARLASTDDFSDFDCADLDKIRDCVKVELEKCENPFPANIVVTFFKFLKKRIPCKNQESVSDDQKNTGPKSRLNPWVHLSSSFRCLSANLFWEIKPTQLKWTLNIRITVRRTAYGLFPVDRPNCTVRKVMPQKQTNFNQSIVNDDIEKALKEKCEKRGAPNAVELLKNEQKRAKECFDKYLNATQIEKELELAQKTGSMDEVFAKYCNIWPLINGCFNNVKLYMRQCMDNNEEESFNKTLDIMEKIKEFMCFRDGDRLALFVAEGGVKCLKEQQDVVNKCINEIFGARLPSTVDFSAYNCADLDKLRKCVNVELEKCEGSLAADIVDAFFKFLKKQIPCQNRKSVSAALNDSDGKSENNGS